MSRHVLAEKRYHESGHAVAAYVQGVGVTFVTTLEIDNLTAAGALTHCATYLARNADRSAQLAAIAKDIIICLAGPYAQAKHRPQKAKQPYEWETDKEHATMFATRAALVASGVDAQQLNDPNDSFSLNVDQITYANDLLQHCGAAARDLVAEHWPKIVKVAEALLTRPILNDDDLDELIGNVPRLCGSPTR